MKTVSILEQNALSISLIPITIRELLFVQELPCHIYGVRDKLFEIFIKKHAIIEKNRLKKLITNGHTGLYVTEEGIQKLKEIQQENLRNITRSLSIGDPLEKAKKQLCLLSINMAYLYRNPVDDETLNLQYQSIKTLCQFLLANPAIHKELFEKYLQQNHYYIFAQPLISSFFLVGLLKQSYLYNEKDIEKLFVTSYFKDIGMSAIPTSKYDLENLSKEDKELFLKHPSLSVEILQDRLPLSPSSLKIIENHHIFSLLSRINNLEANQDDILISGLELNVVSIMDIIAAMISERPYRKALELYDALGFVKMLMADQLPSEFKLIVNFFKQFYSS